MMHMANYWDNIDQGKEIGKEIGRTLEKANSLINHVTKYMNNTGASLEDSLKVLGETMEDYLKAKEILDNQEE